jgi:hypothetical protein
MTTTEEFSPLTLAEITAATAKEKENKVDAVWSERISTLNIGGGFLIKRTEAETQRAIKTRINRAAEASGRKLTWYPQSGTLADGKPSSYVVKVTAINVVQNGQNGTSQAQQPSEPAETPTEASEENAPVGPRRARP